MTPYVADHEHHTGRVLGRISENFALNHDGILEATGEWLWIAEDQLEDAMERLA